jgi:hypothetical protein
MENIKDMVELSYKEKELIKKALCLLKRDFRNSQRCIEAQNNNHREMIKLLIGNDDNKLAKERLERENNSFKKNEEHIEMYDFLISQTNLLIGKLT